MREFPGAEHDEWKTTPPDYGYHDDDPDTEIDESEYEDARRLVGSSRDGAADYFAAEMAVYYDDDAYEDQP